MIRVRLLDKEERSLGTVKIAPFMRNAPDVLVMGVRTFLLNRETPSADPDAVKYVYREGFALKLAATVKPEPEPEEEG